MVRQTLKPDLLTVLKQLVVIFNGAFLLRNLCRRILKWAYFSERWYSIESTNLQVLKGQDFSRRGFFVCQWLKIPKLLYILTFPGVFWQTSSLFLLYEWSFGYIFQAHLGFLTFLSPSSQRASTKAETFQISHLCLFLFFSRQNKKKKKIENMCLESLF